MTSTASLRSTFDPENYSSPQNFLKSDLGGTTLINKVPNELTEVIGTLAPNRAGRISLKELIPFLDASNQQGQQTYLKRLHATQEGTGNSRDISENPLSNPELQTWQSAGASNMSGGLPSRSSLMFSTPHLQQATDMFSHNTTLINDSIGLNNSCLTSAGTSSDLMTLNNLNGSAVTAAGQSISRTEDEFLNLEPFLRMSRQQQFQQSQQFSEYNASFSGPNEASPQLMGQPSNRQEQQLPQQMLTSSLSYLPLPSMVSPTLMSLQKCNNDGYLTGGYGQSNNGGVRPVMSDFSGSAGFSFSGMGGGLGSTMLGGGNTGQTMLGRPSRIMMSAPNVGGGAGAPQTGTYYYPGMQGMPNGQPSSQSQQAAAAQFYSTGGQSIFASTGVQSPFMTPNQGLLPNMGGSPMRQLVSFSSAGGYPGMTYGGQQFPAQQQFAAEAAVSASANTAAATGNSSFILGSLNAGQRAAPLKALYAGKLNLSLNNPGNNGAGTHVGASGNGVSGSPFFDYNNLFSVLGHNTVILPTVNSTANVTSQYINVLQVSTSTDTEDAMRAAAPYLAQGYSLSNLYNITDPLHPQRPKPDEATSEAQGDKTTAWVVLHSIKGEREDFGVGSSGGLSMGGLSPLIILQAPAMLIVDPVTTKLLIPHGGGGILGRASTGVITTVTRASARPGIPSLCNLFLHKKCRQQVYCRQIHADFATVEKYRSFAQNMGCCKDRCGKKEGGSCCKNCGCDIVRLGYHDVDPSVVRDEDDRRAIETINKSMKGIFYRVHGLAPGDVSHTTTVRYETGDKKGEYMSFSAAHHDDDNAHYCDDAYDSIIVRIVIDHLVTGGGGGTSGGASVESSSSSANTTVTKSKLGEDYVDVPFSDFAVTVSFILLFEDFGFPFGPNGSTILRYQCPPASPKKPSAPAQNRLTFVNPETLKNFRNKRVTTSYSNICKLFASGRCKYNDDCRFLHLCWGVHASKFEHQGGVYARNKYCDFQSGG